MPPLYRCYECQHWDNHQQLSPDGSVGFCRAHTPQATLVPVDNKGNATVIAFWPRTHRLDGCGEFKPQLVIANAMPERR
jgi:hypothetical protein